MRSLGCKSSLKTSRYIQFAKAKRKTWASGLEKQAELLEVVPGTEHTFAFTVCVVGTLLPFRCVKHNSFKLSVNYNGLGLVSAFGSIAGVPG